EVILHPIKPEDNRRVYLVWKNAFSDMWTSTAENEEDYQEFLNHNLAGPAFDPAFCYVAWVNDEVVGFVLARIQKGVGVISEVAIHQKWRRRGIARALMNNVLNALYEQGMKQVRLFTNAENEKGARSLYE